MCSISDKIAGYGDGHYDGLLQGRKEGCLFLLEEIEKEVLALADVPRSTAYRGGLRDCILILHKKKEELK